MVRRTARRAELESTSLIDPRLFGRAEVGGGCAAARDRRQPRWVRVVRDAPESGKLRLSEVLVAPYTNPAWTLLFERAAAVVVDSGGPASHAAIVAREYGIPAVMATVEGTRRLVDDQRVRVDGAAGLVLSAGPQTSA